MLLASTPSCCVAASYCSCVPSGLSNSRTKAICTPLAGFDRPYPGCAPQFNECGLITGTTKGDEAMTGKADFTPQEWNTVLEGPPSAGLNVITAQRGGTFRETISMAKAYTEARQHHGASELLDEIVAAKPHVDHTRYHSPDELRQAGLQRVRDAAALLAQN